MRLARKLALALGLGLLVVMAAYAWVQVRHEVMVFDADLGKNAKFGHGAARLIEELWPILGERRMLELLRLADEAGPAETRLRVIWLEIAETLAAERRYVDLSHRSIALATLMQFGVASLIALGLGYWLVGRPIRRLRDHARAVAAGDFDTRLIVPQHDEMGELAVELNGMSRQLAEARDRVAAETEERITTLEQLRHTDRLTTVGRLAAGIAHELGTPSTSSQVARARSCRSAGRGSTMRASSASRRHA